MKQKYVKPDIRFVPLHDQPDLMEEWLRHHVEEGEELAGKEVTAVICRFLHSAVFICRGKRFRERKRQCLGCIKFEV